MFTEVFTHIETNFADHKILLLNPDSSHCLDAILAETYKHHASALIGKNPPISQNMIDYTFALLSSGCTQVILKWIENDFKESPEEMAKLINAFTNYGITSNFE